MWFCEAVMGKSVFEPGSFAQPGNEFRPLQIVHGLDHHLDDPVSLTGTHKLDAFLEKLARLGTGGIVTNVGFRDYLVSPQQWDVLRYGMQKASDLGLRLWLYDEKGYPSGTAGGIVTRANPEYTALGLACYPFQVSGPAPVDISLPVSCRQFVWAGAVRDASQAQRSQVVALVDRVDEWGRLHWTAPEGRWTVIYLAERVMYEGTHAAVNVCEFKQYINTLNPEAVRSFLRVTHEAYRRELPDEIWEKVEAIFTDEPSFMTYYMPSLPERFIGKIPVVDTPLFTDRPMAAPWVSDFLDQFTTIKGYDLKPYLFALFYSGSDEACQVRQDYYDVVTRLYARAFFGQIQDWCRANKIASSGHVLLEESIYDHVIFQGSLMAMIRKMDLPGIDMLNSDPQQMIGGGSFMGQSFMAVKQVASAAHLAGCERVHSESSDWEQGNQGRFATLAERRGQANLQYVLGINMITSYFGWQEIGEEGQKAYHDYVGRLGCLLTGGKHACDAAVLYPIRTMWAHFLPPEQPFATWAERTHRSAWVGQVAETYPALVQTLLTHQVDVDIIDEEAISAGEMRDGALHAAGEAYRAIILPPLDALALETAQALVQFCQAGGVVFCTGALPRLADSPANRAGLREALVDMAATGRAMVVKPEQLVGALRRFVPADLALDGENDQVLYTHRVLEGRGVYFIVNNSPEPTTIRPALRQAGPYHLYLPLTGEVRLVEEPLTLTLGGYEAVFVVCGTGSQINAEHADEHR
jgi:hypothetical protein